MSGAAPRPSPPSPSSVLDAKDDAWISTTSGGGYIAPRNPEEAALNGFAVYYRSTVLRVRRVLGQRLGQGLTGWRGSGWQVSQRLHWRRRQRDPREPVAVAAPAHLRLCCLIRPRRLFQPLHLAPRTTNRTSLTDRPGHTLASRSLLTGSAGACQQSGTWRTGG